MYLYQKLGYEVRHITDVKQFEQIKQEVENLEFSVYDTETTGLHLITDTPFLYTFAYAKVACWFIPTKELVEGLFEALGSTVLFAHNAQFDYHMTWNFLGYESKALEKICADSLTVARLTEYTDSEDDSISLETLGSKYVDKESKFAGKVIKSLITSLDRESKKIAKQKFYEKFGKGKFSEHWEYYTKEFIPFVSEETEEYQFFKEVHRFNNYEDVFKAEPELMISYALDDVVILNEYLKISLPVLMKADKGLNTFNRERQLIGAIARMEKHGLPVDINYFLESKDRVSEYRETLYQELWEIVGKKISVGQHAVIIAYFKETFGILMNSADKDSLSSVETSNPKARKVLDLIIELRSLDKWLKTYIYGKLKTVVNGKIYTSVNNSGTVSGRVSCNMQQQPKGALYDRDGNELFHPRRCFINESEDYCLIYEDMSQMELRVQAYYTLLVGSGDVNMCRAYIPFNCKSIITGEYYNPEEDIDSWNSGEWVLAENEDLFWQPTDLHSVTTLTAFPHLNNDEHHPEFKKLRKLGKMCNFLKNYGGGVNAIIEQLDVEDSIATKLDEAYYTAYPQVKTYQNWVTQTLTRDGYVSNLYGRAYYLQNSRNFYKACNYVIQGTCADLMKVAELKIDKLLEGKKSKFLLPIHDEVMCSIHKDEMYLIAEIKKIMEDCRGVMPLIPMISDIEISYTNWADKEDYYL